MKWLEHGIFVAGVLKYDATTQRVIWGKSYYLELQDAGDAVSELEKGFFEKIPARKLYPTQGTCISLKMIFLFNQVGYVSFFFEQCSKNALCL